MFMSKERNKIRKLTSSFWLAKFLLKSGYIATYTSILSFIVINYGIWGLSWFYILKSTITILSSGISLKYLKNLNLKQALQILSCLLAICFIFAAIVYHGNFFLFVTINMIILGVIYPKIFIIFSSYQEKFYSPKQSIHHGPIIESAETFAGIGAGILVSLFALKYGISPLLMICGALSSMFTVKLSLIKDNHQLRINKVKEIKKDVKTEIFENKFIQLLGTILFFNGIISLMIEFQYTFALESQFHFTKEELHLHELSIAENFAHIQIFFNSLILIIQLFFSSKIFNSLGIVRSFMLHSIATFMSVVAMIVNFSLNTTVIAKSNFEITNMITKNALEIMHYVFKDGTQKIIRDLIDGIFYPLATIVATFLLIFIENFFLEKHFILVINTLLIGLIGALFYFSAKTQNHMILHMKKKLQSSEKESQLHAIELLSQPGHFNGKKILKEALASGHLHPEARNMISQYITI